MLTGERTEVGYDSISFVFSSKRAARSFLSEKDWACSWGWGSQVKAGYERANGERRGRTLVIDSLLSLLC